MKIKFSDDVEINVNIREEYNSQEFAELLSKLHSIQKMLGRDLLSMSGGIGIKKKGRPSSNPVNNIARIKRAMKRRDWCNTREKAIDVIKMHYHGTKEEKTKWSQKNNVIWNDAVKSMYALKNRYNIQASEVDMKRFPVRNEITQEQITALKIKRRK
jgi:hypothetical protein